jgi:hypothetical protein
VLSLPRQNKHLIRHWILKEGQRSLRFEVGFTKPYPTRTEKEELVFVAIVSEIIYFLGRLKETKCYFSLELKLSHQSGGRQSSDHITFIRVTVFRLISPTEL